jgi:hypothetical protein
VVSPALGAAFSREKDAAVSDLIAQTLNRIP